MAGLAATGRLQVLRREVAHIKRDGGGSGTFRSATRSEPGMFMPNVRRATWLAFSLCLAFALPFASAAPAVRDGDLIFHTSRSAQSAAIQRATHSPYSHVGGP